MSSKLASETQARLGLDERFDVQLKVSVNREKILFTLCIL